MAGLSSLGDAPPLGGGRRASTVSRVRDEGNNDDYTKSNSSPKKQAKSKAKKSDKRHSTTGPSANDSDEDLFPKSRGLVQRSPAKRDNKTFNPEDSDEFAGAKPAYFPSAPKSATASPSATSKFSMPDSTDDEDFLAGLGPPKKGPAASASAEEEAVSAASSPAPRATTASTRTTPKSGFTPDKLLSMLDDEPPSISSHAISPIPTPTTPAPAHDVDLGMVGSSRRVSTPTSRRGRRAGNETDAGGLGGSLPDASPSVELMSSSASPPQDDFLSKSPSSRTLRGPNTFESSEVTPAEVLSPASSPAPMRRLRDHAPSVAGSPSAAPVTPAPVAPTELSASSSFKGSRGAASKSVTFNDSDEFDLPGMESENPGPSGTAAAGRRTVKASPGALSLDMGFLPDGSSATTPPPRRQPAPAASHAGNASDSSDADNSYTPSFRPSRPTMSTPSIATSSINSPATATTPGGPRPRRSLVDTGSPAQTPQTPMFSKTPDSTRSPVDDIRERMAAAVARREQLEKERAASLLAAQQAATTPSASGSAPAFEPTRPSSSPSTPAAAAGATKPVSVAAMLASGGSTSAPPSPFRTFSPQSSAIPTPEFPIGQAAVPTAVSPSPAGGFARSLKDFGIDISSDDDASNTSSPSAHSTTRSMPEPPPGVVSLRTSPPPSPAGNRPAMAIASVDPNPSQYPSASSPKATTPSAATPPSPLLNPAQPTISGFNPSPAPSSTTMAPTLQHLATPSPLGLHPEHLAQQPQQLLLSTPLQQQINEDVTRMLQQMRQQVDDSNRSLEEMRRKEQAAQAVLKERETQLRGRDMELREVQDRLAAAEAKLKLSLAEVQAAAVQEAGQLRQELEEQKREGARLKRLGEEERKHSQQLVNRLKDELESVRVSHSAEVVKLRMEAQDSAKRDYERGRREALAEKEVLEAQLRAQQAALAEERDVVARHRLSADQLSKLADQVRELAGTSMEREGRALQALERDVADREARAHARENLVAEREARVAAREQEMDALRQELRGLVVTLEGSVANDRADLRKEHTRLGRESARVDAIQGALLGEREELHAAVQLERQLLEEARTQRRKEREEYLSQMAAERKRVVEDQVALQREVDNQRGELMALQAQLVEMQTRTHLALQETKTVESELNELRSQRDAEAAAIAEARAGLKELQEALNTEKEELAEYTGMVTQQGAELAARSGELTEQQKAIDELQGKVALEMAAAELARKEAEQDTNRLTEIKKKLDADKLEVEKARKEACQGRIEASRAADKVHDARMQLAEAVRKWVEAGIPIPVAVDTTAGSLVAVEKAVVHGAQSGGKNKAGGRKGQPAGKNATKKLLQRLGLEVQQQQQELHSYIQSQGEFLSAARSGQGHTAHGMLPSRPTAHMASGLHTTLHADPVAGPKAAVQPYGSHLPRSVDTSQPAAPDQNFPGFAAVEIRARTASPTSFSAREETDVDSKDPRASAADRDIAGQAVLAALTAGIKAMEKEAATADLEPSGELSSLLSLHPTLSMTTSHGDDSYQQQTTTIGSHTPTNSTITGTSS